mmetsp:Transcript_40877/g.105707  ORF Transcript_40877/g.105707 Transcript_40877/m.105707 type:complete len:95 (-) Transcript_40877:295-579(-)
MSMLLCMTTTSPCLALSTSFWITCTVKAPGRCVLRRCMTSAQLRLKAFCAIIVANIGMSAPHQNVSAVVMGATWRYRSKYVTSVIYKPIGQHGH